MSGKIFYRKRRKMTDGSKQPRFIIVAIAGADLKVYGKHLRMSELKAIAEGIGAEMVALPRGPKHENDEDDE